MNHTYIYVNQFRNSAYNISLLLPEARLTKYDVAKCEVEMVEPTVTAAPSLCKFLARVRALDPSALQILPDLMSQFPLRSHHLQRLLLTSCPFSQQHFPLPQASTLPRMKRSMPSIFSAHVESPLRVASLKYTAQCVGRTRRTLER